MTIRNKNYGAEQFITIKGRIKEVNNLRIKTVIVAWKSDGIINEFPETFEGIGCFRNKQTGEPIEVRLEMDQEAIPIMQKPRNVVYYLQQSLKKWLDQGVEEGIFEPVPDGELITWCSPLVVQPKPKYTNIE